MKKKILITGAGTGIGKSAAIELAKRGHFVLATTHYEEEARMLNDYAQRNKLNIVSFKMDILEKKDRMKVLDYDIDVLINNAALGDSGSIAEIDINRLRKTFETNIFATVSLTQEILCKFMEVKAGRIIFISSLFGRISIPFLSPYTATKFALEAIVYSLKEELKQLKDVKIDIAIIEPGAYKTGFNKVNMVKKYEWMEKKSYFKEQLNRIKYKEEIMLNKLESNNIDSIVKEYIKAVEDEKLKDRYISPKYQGYVVQGLRILGK